MMTLLYNWLLSGQGEKKSEFGDTQGPGKWQCTGGQEWEFSLLGWKGEILARKPTNLKSYDTAQTWRVMDIKYLSQSA